MSRLYLLVGPIGSGKSTYCRDAAKAGAIIVNDDAIVLAVHAGDYTLYNNDLKPLYKGVENSIVQMSLMLGHSVVIDRPNYSRSMRRRYIGLAKSIDVPVEIIMFKRESSEIHAARRNASDCRGYGYDYWLGVAMRHESLYESPDKELEGFDFETYWEFPQ